MTQQDLISMRNYLYNQFPANTPFYFITINLPYSLKTHDIHQFITTIRYLLAKFEKRLLGYDKNWNNHPYMFYAFCENKWNTDSWHIHILAPFINPKTHTQPVLSFVEWCFNGANNLFKRHYKSNRGADYDIQLVPYYKLPTLIKYCTKELYFDYTLHTDRIYTPATIFYKPSKHKRKRTGLPKPIRKMRTMKDLIQILSRKYTIQHNRHK